MSDNWQDHYKISMQEDNDPSLPRFEIGDIVTAEDGGGAGVIKTVGYATHHSGHPNSYAVQWRRGGPHKVAWFYGSELKMITAGPAHNYRLEVIEDEYGNQTIGGVPPALWIVPLELEDE